MTGFRGHVAWEAVDDPRLPFEHVCIQVLQRNRNSNASCIDVPNMAVIRRGARDSSCMNQHAVSDFQIGCVLIELERECISVRNDPRATDRAKITQAKVQPAVIEKIRDILIRMPSLTLNLSRE